jgi:hypothetical protein
MIDLFPYIGYNIAANVCTTNILILVKLDIIFYLLYGTAFVYRSMWNLREHGYGRRDAIIQIVAF